MWTISMLKDNAKSCLKNYYWLGLVAIVIMSVITYVANLILTSILGVLSGIGSSEFFTLMITLVASLAVAVLVSYPLTVGINRFFLDARSGDTEIGKLFYSYGQSRFSNIVCTMFIMVIKVFLWSLLLYIPGIIKTYEYRLVPYIIAENPNIDTRRAFEISRQTMDGEKFNSFVLDLSFIGWYLLGIIAFGIGILFVSPYHQATLTEFYCCMREKALARGYAAYDELPGGFGSTAQSMVYPNSYPQDGFGASSLNQQGFFGQQPQTPPQNNAPYGQPAAPNTPPTMDGIDTPSSDDQNKVNLSKDNYPNDDNFMQ